MLTKNTPSRERRAKGGKTNFYEKRKEWDREKDHLKDPAWRAGRG